MASMGLSMPQWMLHGLWGCGMASVSVTLLQWVSVGVVWSQWVCLASVGKGWHKPQWVYLWPQCVYL